jgi:hypothetical protein
MKNTKALVTVIGIIIIAALGYFLYHSIREINTNETNYEFTLAEPIIIDEFDEVSDLDNSAVEIEVELDNLEVLDYEELTTEENLESEIEDNTNAESDIDSELDELENLNF